MTAVGPGTVEGAKVDGVVEVCEVRWHGEESGSLFKVLFAAWRVGHLGRDLGQYQDQYDHGLE